MSKTELATLKEAHHSYLPSRSNSESTADRTMPATFTLEPGANLHSRPTSTIALITPQDAYNDHLPLWRKSLIVFATSWVALAATFSSTSLFSASEEIAKDFGISMTEVNLSNAGVLFTMAFSGFIWGPIEKIVGRKMAYNACIATLFAFTVGAAIAKNLDTFIVMRVLVGLQGTFFHVAGQAILAENFSPLQRGTATGFFLCGTVLGPPLGPCLTGIVITYSSWRVILWLQAGMAASGFLISFFVIPESSNSTTTAADEKKEVTTTLNWRDILGYFNPCGVLKWLIYPNVLLTDIACGLLSWSQYALLSAPRHILSATFHLNSPLLGGLYYIAPAGGFLMGTIIGGRYSDIIVRKYISKRGGVRLPQDRLNSGMWAFFAVVPVASLLFGWGLECVPKDQDTAPWLALPIITSFFVAAGLLAAFASLNTYCAEVFPKNRVEVITTKYLIQYILAGTTSATTIPLIDAIGIGAMSTISVTFVIIGGMLTWLVAQFGSPMQRWTDGKLKRPFHT